MDVLSTANTGDRRHRRRVLLFVILGAVLVPVFVGCGVIAYFAWDAGAFRSMPSDQQLIDNLGDHRSEFQELVRILKQDQRLRAISLDSTDPALSATGISDARFERYRELMRSAGVDEDIQRERDGQGSISFRVAYKGGALSSDDRGYVYSTQPLTPLVGSLDGDEAMARTAYRHIGGNWYLYRWIDQ